MTPPRVLYIITKAEPGGAQTHVLDLLTTGPAGEKALVTGSGGPLLDRAGQAGIRTWVVPSLVPEISPVTDFKTIHELRCIIRDFRPQIVHCHSSKAGIVGRVAAWMERAPAVFTAHGWAFTEGVPEPRRVIALAAERLVGGLTSAIITVSSHDYDLALKAHVISPDRLRMIHNGAADCPLRAQPDETGRVRIVMVARCGAPKDHLTVLQACTGLRGDWELLLVGDGPLSRQVQQEIDRLDLGGRVSLMGHRDDVPEILAGAHIFCLASDWEGLPISIIEAMRAGLPVVASSVGGVPELVAFGENGFLVGRKDVAGLARYLQTLIDDPALRTQLGTRSRTRYEQEFTLDRQMEKVQAVYEFCLRSPRR